MVPWCTSSCTALNAGSTSVRCRPLSPQPNPHRRPGRWLLGPMYHRKLEEREMLQGRIHPPIDTWDSVILGKHEICLWGNLHMHQHWASLQVQRAYNCHRKNLLLATVNSATPQHVRGQLSNRIVLASFRWTWKYIQCQMLMNSVWSGHQCSKFFQILKWSMIWTLLSNCGLLRWTITPHITLEEEPAWKDQTVEINCIQPQPIPVVWGGTHRWYGLLLEVFSEA
jgi:hypothetical protein